MENTPTTVNAIFYVNGNISNRQTDFLLDSGAAISVVHHKLVPSHISISGSTTAAVSATGAPLDIAGRATLPVSLGTFTVTHEFTIVRHLTVDCLLGADFLKRYKAIVDCGNSVLYLTDREHQYTIPVTQGAQLLQQVPPTSNIADDFTVSAPTNITIPGRTVQFIAGKLNVPCNATSALVDPLARSPTHICVAHSLSPLTNNTDILLQVMNISPTPVTIYKGTKLATMTPEHDVMLISHTTSPTDDNSTSPPTILDQIDLSHLTTEEHTELAKLLTDFSHVFAENPIPTGHTSIVKHSIHTTGPPIRQPLRRIPQALKSVVGTEVQRMLDHNVIRPSSSPWSSPVIMVRKKDGTWRFCIDYRKLNAVTCRDAYPLPRIDSTLDSLAGATYFTTLDLASGYWQVAVEEQDKEKTAFSTPDGHFEFNVMPFGLTNAPATFQRLMECVLAGLVGEQCLIYLDDIIVFSSTFKEHVLRLSGVFQALNNAGLQLKPSKCHFALKEVRYLGHVVSQAGIRPDDDKVKAVSTYPVPRTTKELKRFLGLTNYYRRFIKDYAHIAEPLHKVQGKSKQSLQWDASCQLAFDTLKQKLTTPPILAYPDFSSTFLVYSDASDTAIGGLLGQIQHNKEVVISYWSRQLTKAERNYSAIEREALAAVSTIKEFYPYVYGFSFKLITDHNPLTSLHSLKDVGGRLSRWIIYLQQFDFEVKYRAGKEHTNADALSRIPPVDAVMPVMEYQLGSATVDLQAAQQADEQLSAVIVALSSNSPLPCRVAPGLKQCFLQNGVLCRKFQGLSNTGYTQLVLPSSLRHSALQHLHNELGHLGLHKTMEAVKQRYYWPGYEGDIQKWIAECASCQQRNAPQPTAQAPLGTISSKHPFDKISWDIMGPLPLTTQGNKYVLVVTDLFSKWTEAFPLKTTDSETLATVLINEVICRYGMPSSLHSDQGANLTSNLISSLCQNLGIAQTRTSAYHPQGNAQVERFNRTLEAMLAKTVSDNQKDWDQHIPKLMFAYRTTIHESTGYTPFHVTFGRSPVLPVDIMIGAGIKQKEATVTVPQFVRDLHSSLKTVYSQVREGIKAAHHRNKTRYDRHTANTYFSIGDQVWLYVPAIKTGTTKKLACLWRGPYTIIDKLSALNYRIQLLGVPTKTLVVHHNRLKHCFGTPKSPPEYNSQHPPMTNSSRLYSDVVRRQAPAAGYTTSLPDAPPRYGNSARPDSQVTSTAPTTRPQRTHRIPTRYNDFVPP